MPRGITGPQAGDVPVTSSHGSTGKARLSGAALTTAETGARGQAERALSGVLSLIVIGSFVTQPLSLASVWASSNYAVAGFAVPAVGLTYGASLLRESRRPPRSMGDSGGRVGGYADLIFIALMALAGLAIEAVDLSPTVAASMNNVGFPALGACTYAGAIRLPWRQSLPITLTAAAGHLVALRGTPTEGLQGAVQLAAIWATAVVVATEMRRAGRVAEDACAAARDAEREEASARVHDALGLLRVAARGGGANADLQRAAEETTRRTGVWLHGSSPVVLATSVNAVVAQFPDLTIDSDISALPREGADPVVVTAVARAVHTLLGNVREHARATRVEIRAGGGSGGWWLSIRDDGRGFDTGATTPRAGLTRYTRDGLEAVGVVMKLRTAPGLGTTATLLGPLRAAPATARRTRPHLSKDRFAAWRNRPSDGVGRASRISDLIQAGLVASYVTMALAGFAHLLHDSERQTVAGVLVITGAAALAVLWLSGPRPPAILAVTATVFAVGAGAVITVLNGSDATLGDKLGIMLMAWSGMLLAAARPEYRWIAVSLSLVPLAVVGSVDVVSGVVSALFMVITSLVAGQLVSSLTDLGQQADADRLRAADAERRRAAPLLLRQATLIHDAATGAGRDVRAPDRMTERLSVVAQQAEDYLRAPRECPLGVGLRAGLTARYGSEGGIDVDTGDLDYVLDGAATTIVVAAVTEITVLLVPLDALPADGSTRASIRAVGSGTPWQLSLLTQSGGVSTDDVLVRADWQRLREALAVVSIELSARAVAGGLYVQLRPIQVQPRQETTIDMASPAEHSEQTTLCGSRKRGS